jgi:tyrosyl-tRNA synthetase
LLSKEEIEQLDKEHDAAPHLRILQKALAKDVTIRVHSDADYQAAIEASEILFKGTLEQLGNLYESTFLDVFEGVPQFEIGKEQLLTGINIVDFLTVNTSVFPSKGEARKMISGGGVSLNKQKIENETHVVTTEHLINQKYLLVQKGKKNYFLIKVNN